MSPGAAHRRRHRVSAFSMASSTGRTRVSVAIFALSLREPAILAAPLRQPCKRFGEMQVTPDQWACISTNDFTRFIFRFQCRFHGFRRLHD